MQAQAGTRATTQRRDHVRVDVDVTLTLVLNGEDVAFTTLDLSAGGALIRLPDEIDLGDVADVVRYRLEMPGDRVVTGFAAIARKEVNGMCAVTFKALGAHDEDVIVAFVAEVQRRQLRNGVLVADRLPTLVETRDA